jgi:hypothetical protein
MQIVANTTPQPPLLVVANPEFYLPPMARLLFFPQLWLISIKLFFHDYLYFYAYKLGRSSSSNCLSWRSEKENEKKKKRMYTV